MMSFTPQTRSKTPASLARVTRSAYETYKKCSRQLTIGRQNRTNGLTAYAWSLGNRLRHEYDTVSIQVIWSIVSVDLLSLADACRDALMRIESSEI